MLGVDNIIPSSSARSSASLPQDMTDVRIMIIASAVNSINFFISNLPGGVLSIT